MATAIPYIDATMNADYPFRDGFGELSYSGVPLQRKWFSDTELILGVNSANMISAWPFLESIYSNETDVTFDICFRVQNQDLSFSDTYFSFTFPTNSPPGTTSWVNASTSSGGSLSPDTGFGFLQIGDLSFFTSSSLTLTGSSASLTPGTWVSMADHFVTSVNIANQISTLPQDPCNPSSSYIPSYVGNTYSDPNFQCAGSGDYRMVSERGITGPLILGPGINCTSDVNTAINGVSFLPSAGGVTTSSATGNTVNVYPGGYTPPATFSCNGIVSVGGAVPAAGENTVFMVGGPGVTISAASSVPNTIDVVLDSTVVFIPDSSTPCSVSSYIMPLAAPTTGYNTVGIYNLDSMVYAVPAGTAFETSSMAAGNYQLIYVSGAYTTSAGPSQVYNQVGAGGLGDWYVKYNNGTSYVSMEFPDVGTYSTYQEASDAWANTAIDFAHSGGPIFISLYSNSLLDNGGSVTFELRVQ